MFKRTINKKPLVVLTSVNMTNTQINIPCIKNTTHNMTNNKYHEYKKTERYYNSDKIIG